VLNDNERRLLEAVLLCIIIVVLHDLRWISGELGIALAVVINAIQTYRIVKKVEQ
jgi:hypothetical protein